jgi:hypothetical protein
MKVAIFLVFLLLNINSAIADSISCFRKSAIQEETMALSFNIPKWRVEFRVFGNESNLKCSDLGDNTLGAWVTCYDENTSLNMAFFDKFDWPYFEVWVWRDYEASKAVRYDCELLNQKI